MNVVLRSAASLSDMLNNPQGDLYFYDSTQQLLVRRDLIQG